MSSGIKNSVSFSKATMILLFVFGTFLFSAENLKRIIDLEGNWKFTVGDEPAWAMVDYNDRDWDDVTVPGNWESDGFVGYNGFAWYRKAFYLTNGWDEMSPFLVMGYIDDVDEVYLNGHLIGASGIMPPKMTTAYLQLRRYPLPVELLNPDGKNVIAVRVFDEYREGGIFDGPVGIYWDQDNELLSLNLAGYWDFEPLIESDNTASRFYNQENGKIYVPGYWENFGYASFDGTAVYTKTFRISLSFDTDDIMIVLGYIDDIDKVYINDERIGTIETAKNDPDQNLHLDLVFRGYAIPPGILKKGEINTLKVKVYDTGGLGGIYEGPVGLVTSENYKLLNRTKEEKRYNVWDQFIKNIFGWE